MAEKNVAQITLPTGMTSEDFNKAFASWMKQRVSTKERDTATRKAQKDLIAAHKAEYDGLLKSKRG